MSLSAPRWRVAVLVAMGAWVVHQLRYALAFGGDAATHTHEHAHQYLEFVGPLLVWAVAAASASWVISLGRPAARGGSSPCRARTIWLRASLALTTIYCVQETAEGLLVQDHPPVLLGVFGHGGWIAIPLSLLVAAGIAFALRSARAVREVVARARQVLVALVQPLLRGAVAHSIDRVRPSHVLATKLAGRAPPRTV